MVEPPSPPNLSQDASTVASLERTHWAAIRTLLAAVRTGAVVAGGGAVVTDLLIRGWPRWVVGTVSGGFVLVGYWLMWSALRLGRRLRRGWASHRPVPVPAFLYPMWQIAAFSLALQVLIGSVVVLYLLRR